MLATRFAVNAVVRGCAMALLTLVPTVTRAQSTPPPPPSPGTAWVWTTLPSLDDPARIEVFSPREIGAAPREEDDQHWRTLCRAPCAQWIPAGSRLRVNGDFRVGAPFTLPAAPAVRFEVYPASLAPGIVVASLSASAVGAAAALYALGDVKTKTSGQPPEERARLESADRTRNQLLLGTAIVGIVGVGAGLWLMLANDRTTVHLRTSGSPGVPLARGLSLSAAGLHF